MASNIKINLLKNKPKYTANLGENNYRVYTPGEPITEQKDFMRLIFLCNQNISAESNAKLTF